MSIIAYLIDRRLFSGSLHAFRRLREVLGKMSYLFLFFVFALGPALEQYELFRLPSPTPSPPFVVCAFKGRLRDYIFRAIHYR